jgi:hypothetical protein
MQAVAVIANLRRQAERCRETARYLSLKHEAEEMIALARTYEAEARTLEARREDCLHKKPNCR